MSHKNAFLLSHINSFPSFFIFLQRQLKHGCGWWSVDLYLYGCHRRMTFWMMLSVFVIFRLSYFLPWLFYPHYYRTWSFSLSFDSVKVAFNLLLSAFVCVLHVCSLILNTIGISFFGGKTLTLTTLRLESRTPFSFTLNSLCIII